MNTDISVPRTAHGQAYSYLREAILSGAYPGGARIDIPEAAAKLGMSRMPVREALRQLDTEGLVTIRPNRGAVVTKLTPDEILEIFEMRAVLEGLAARVALPNLDQEAFEDLALLVERMDRSRGNIAQWLRLHNEFHDYIVRKSGRPRLVAQTLLLRRAVEPYFRVHVGAYDREEVLGAEHSTLLEVLRAGDPAKAEATMRQHVERAAAFIVDFVKRAGGTGDPDVAAP